jgi:hypothetical protein
MKRRNTGPDLFGYVPPAEPERYPNAPGWTEPTTSKQAAEAIRPYATAQGLKILQFLKGRGAHGATYLEIADGSGVCAQSVCGRMVALREAGKVTIAPFRRLTPSKRKARVYLAVER